MSHNPTELRRTFINVIFILLLDKISPAILMCTQLIRKTQPIHFFKFDFGKCQTHKLSSGFNGYSFANIRKCKMQKLGKVLSQKSTDTNWRQNEGTSHTLQGPFHKLYHINSLRKFTWLAMWHKLAFSQTLYIFAAYIYFCILTFTTL